MSRIARFEALAEHLVEGTFARLFAGHLCPLEVATHLARAMEDHQAVTPDGAVQAPTHFWVYLHPTDHAALTADRPMLEMELARHMTELAQSVGLALESAPVVYLLPDEAIFRHGVRVEARRLAQEAAPGEGTREMERETSEEEGAALEEPPPGRPFLILDGHRHFELLQPVVSIGRALDNDVILEDPRVSRHQVQLRRRYGRYVLYDLNSSGGTTINGYPVEECVLHAGDVVSLAGVELIYGEDAPTPIPLPTGSTG